MKRTVALLIVALAAPIVASAAPNFVVVYVDDLGWAETSVEMIKGRPDTRSDYYQTPNIERIARDGMVLSSCYSPSALCAPSRNSLLHGMTPSRLRYTVLSAVEAKKKYMGQVTIPQALKKADPEYTTAHFGKWHNESIKPTEAGYDVTDGPNGNGPGDFADDRKTHLPDDDPKRIFSLTHNSIQFMKDQVAAEKPFYLQLSHYAMHIWHDSLKETREKYKMLPKGRKYGKQDDTPEEDISIATYNHGWIHDQARLHSRKKVLLNSSWRLTTCVPIVTYVLWKEAFRLLQQERSSDAATVLVNHEGAPLKVGRPDDEGKLEKFDNVASVFSWLKRKKGIKNPLKYFRKTSANLLKLNKDYRELDVLFLGHAPATVAERHYTQAPQQLLNEALVWLGQQVRDRIERA